MNSTPVHGSSEHLLKRCLVAALTIIPFTSNLSVAQSTTPAAARSPTAIKYPFKQHNGHLNLMVAVAAGPFMMPAVLPPAIAWFNGAWWAAWKGEAGDDRLFYANSADWSNVRTIPGNSGGGPSLAVARFNNKELLYAAWKGKGLDQRLFYAWMDESGIWSVPATGDQTIPGNSSVGPTLAFATFGTTSRSMPPGRAKTPTNACSMPASTAITGHCLPSVIRPYQAIPASALRSPQ
jgi:hypothetical protein